MPSYGDVRVLEDRIRQFRQVFGIEEGLGTLEQQRLSIALFGPEIDRLAGILGADAPVWFQQFNAIRDEIGEIEPDVPPRGDVPPGDLPPSDIPPRGDVPPGDSGSLSDLEGRVDRWVQNARGSGLQDDEIAAGSAREFGAEIIQMHQTLGADAPAWMDRFVRIGRETGFIDENGAFLPDLVPDTIAGFMPPPGTTDIDQAQKDLLGILTGEFDVGSPRTELGQRELSRLALNLPELSASELLGSDILRRFPDLALSGREGDVDVISRIIRGEGLGPQFGTRNFGEIDLNTLVQRNLAGVLGGDTPIPNIGALDALVGSNIGAAQGLTPDTLASARGLLGDGALSSAEQASRNLTGLGDQTPLSNFIQQSLGPDALSGQFAQSFKRRFFDPAREDLLNELAAKGVLNTSERVRQEQDLFETSFIDPLMLQDRQARENAAQIAAISQGQGVRGLIGTGAARGDVLGTVGNLGAGFQDRALSGFGTTNQLLMNLIGTAGQVGQTDFSQRLSALGLGQQQTQTAADLANLNRMSAQQLFGTRAGMFGDIRDFSQERQNASRVAGIDLIGQEMNRRAGVQIAAENRRLGTQSLWGAGIGAAGPIFERILKRIFPEEVPSLRF